MESRIFTYMIMIFVLASIFYNDMINLDGNMYILLATSILLLGTLGVYIYDPSNEKANNIQKFILGIYIISVIGYTIYQWKILLEKKEADCGFLLPHSSLFNTSQYYLYRILYLVTLIVIVSLLQFKIEDKLFRIPWVPDSILKYFVFMIPVIVPLLTEISDTFINDLPFIEDKEVSNPESLLANFVIGDATNPVFGLHTIMSLCLYALLMFVMVDSSYGITPFWESRGNTSIYIGLFFVIFFSFIMRTIFIQDCSLSKNISKIDKEDYANRFDCIFEKYGGFQSMLCTSLIIVLIYNIKNPIYKILFFLIICLASWGLSTTYMLTLK
jgi:hypothetical protein